MSALPVLFPFLVVAAALAVVAAAVRLHLRLSVAVGSAGEWHTEQPPKPGVKHTPTQLRTIDSEVLVWMTSRAGSAHRHELAATINRLLDTVHATNYGRLTDRSTTDDLLHALDFLEAELALPPLEG